MPHSKRKSIRTIAWCLAVFAAVALIVTFPAGWGAWCATRIVRGLLADSGMTCEKVDWISPFSFEAHGFAMPGKPGEIRLNRVIANYSPGSLIRENRVKSLDAVGFSMDLADMLKPQTVEAQQKDDHYIVFTVTRQEPLPEIDYLRCRQIVRDHGDATHRRACGISLTTHDSPLTTITITLPTSHHGQV
jgi:hypothetical protein